MLAKRIFPVLLFVTVSNSVSAATCEEINHKLAGVTEIISHAQIPVTFEQQLKTMPRNLDPISGLGQVTSFDAGVKARARREHAKRLALIAELEKQAAAQGCD